ncbi:tRNA uridine-5-carboxymethylaminomethyl(34) synthesis enzyme MnmG [Fusobacterium ulcerans]|uniref:tRNA uridine-5-carboxymethylaminomethyl(34) synthesis enzyme MnmG n=1 Tax=Fusobacterium ulcerans TaxID=861 RepID=UPI002673CD6D|nr:tRNA uridine-5-carboxymethylaminomethyl(34) synthesis enzyme MnmG [Fusobacterium ulcerans]
MEMKQYEVIVVGGGHGGVEASLAAARLGKKTAMFTLYLDTIAMMSCNPSIGGPGKSNLVAEMDILGGEMGRHTDKFNLQLKHLNESKGPAARITRGQADKYLYRTEMRKLLEHTDNLEIIQDCVDEIIVEDGKVKGIITRLGIKYYAQCVVLATGTFLKGKIVIGDVAYSAGRQGENSAEKLSDSLREHGITIERYQTATPPRLDKRSIDFSKMKELKGEEHPRYFSIFTDKERNNVVPTWLTYTTEKTIEVAKEMLQYSPIVSGIIKTHGPRHCPSLDRKVINFPDKSNHQIFLELESAESEEVYVNGLTTAMPPFAQEAMMRTIAGLENARVMRYGYAVEYDYAPAAQLYPSLESKKVEGLYFAGQINGTSGYEEAACQGFIAGVNAARKADGKEPVIIDRSEGYIGVLIDDIIHKKTPEPYRVLPSRSEYRLTLRFDNAFMRLFTKAKEIGILSSEKLDYLENSIKIVNDEIARLKEISVPMVQANALLEKLGSDQKLTKGVKIGDLLKIKEVTYDSLKDITEISDYPGFIKNQIETMIKYEIFIQRENEQIEKFKRLEEVRIPADFDFSDRH